jgi:hypothetical protein
MRPVLPFRQFSGQVEREGAGRVSLSRAPAHVTFAAARSILPTDTSCTVILETAVIQHPDLISDDTDQRPIRHSHRR